MPQLPYKPGSLEWPPSPEQLSLLDGMLDDIYQRIGASGVTEGTYGDVNHVPVVTVDARGRITEVSETLIGGTYILLEEHTAAADATLDFTTRNCNGFTGATFQSDFDEYVIRVLGLTPGTNNVDFRCRFSSNGGSSYDSSAIYDQTYNWGAPPDGNVGGGGGTGATYLDIGGNVGNNANTGIYSELIFHNPLSTTNYKVIQGLSSFEHDTLGFMGWRRGFQYRSTSSVNAFQISVSSGTISGTVRVYGISKTGLIAPPLTQSPGSATGDLTRINDTNVTMALGGDPVNALLKDVSLTLGWTGTLGLARGGTAADLSATGGAKQYLKQASAGAAITVGTIPASDVVSSEVTVTTTGNIDDLSFSNANVIRMNNASLSTIRGLAAGTAGQQVTIVSIGAGQVDLADQNTNSTAANRLICHVTSAVTSLAAGKGSATFEYDATTARWRLVEHNQGAWIAPSFASGNFTAGGSMTWTVESGDVFVYAYKLEGRTLLVSFTVITTTVGGSVSDSLQIAIPGGFTSNRYTASTIWYSDNGTGGFGRAQVAGSGSVIGLAKVDLGNWTLSTNNTSIQGEIAFEVT